MKLGRSLSDSSIIENWLETLRLRKQNNLRVMWLVPPLSVFFRADGAYLALTYPRLAPCVGYILTPLRGLLAFTTTFLALCSTAFLIFFPRAAGTGIIASNLIATAHDLLYGLHITGTRHPRLIQLTLFPALKRLFNFIDRC
jgi:hypothetical protein